MKKYLLQTGTILFLLSCSIRLFGEIPPGYYDQAEGKKKEVLKTALHNIIKDANVLQYGSGAGKTWSGFAKTDVREDGTVWDMYSNNKVPVNGNSAASGMNIEHSFAKSWWGGSKRQSYMDIHHLNPSNSGANSAKGSWPMGVVDGKKTYDNGVIKVGKSSSRGGEITAWEPADMYKGDFARVYMYMVTCYENFASDWTGNSVNQLDNNTYPVFEPWAYELLLKWSREDPVSTKETNRNEEVYKIQGNRNPFIDYPELAEYIWGTHTNDPFYTQQNTDPVLLSPVAGSTIDAEVCPVNIPVTRLLNIKARNLKGDLKLTVTSSYFTLSRLSVTKAEAETGCDVVVTYRPEVTGAHTGLISITGEGINTTINLKGEAVDGIPALPANAVTATGFIARWMKLQSVATVQLDVYTKEGQNRVSLPGYPVSVSDAAQYAVTGLQPNTDYYYSVAGSGLTSNEISVKTLIPVPVINLEFPDGDLEFTAAPGFASDYKIVRVMGEYISAEMNVTLDQPFEMSIDKESWVQQLTLPIAGGTLYVRLAAVATGGVHMSDLTISTPQLEVDEVIGVTGRSEILKVFLEDFELGVKGSYEEGTVTCSMTEWRMNNTLIGTQSGDCKHGSKAVRMNSGFIEMTTDKPNGIGTVSLHAASFGSDGDGALKLSYSIDGGTNWIAIASDIVTKDKTLQLYSYQVDVPGNVRIKIEQTSGRRVNVDDIAMSDYLATGLDDENMATTITYVQQNRLVIESATEGWVEIYNLVGQSVTNQWVAAGRTEIILPTGTYLVRSEALKLSGVKVFIMP